MAYNEDKKSTELDELTALDANDVFIVGDYSDSGRAKKITKSNVTPDSSTTTKGFVKMSTAPASATEPIAVGTNDTRVPTQGENDALAGGSTLGTPSSTNKFLTQDVTSSATYIPIVRTYLNAASPATWTKPAGLKYVIVEVQAGGGGGGSVSTSFGQVGCGGGGGGGGYSKKLIAVATLGGTETVTIGAGGASGSTGGTSSFGAHATATGGAGGVQNAQGGEGGIGSSGDINIKGGGGGGGGQDSDNIPYLGTGGSSFYGGGATSKSTDGAGIPGYVYGGGGGGARAGSEDNFDGGVGGAGIVIVTEYYI